MVTIGEITGIADGGVTGCCAAVGVTVPPKETRTAIAKKML
jgi:hypothetical protein